MKRSQKNEFQQRNNKDGDRREYLQQLATEFTVSPSLDAKCQVLANLSNFAYDPANYQYLREAGVPGIFLDCLKSDNNDFVQYSSGGICNLCIDPINAKYILNNNGIQILVDLLRNDNEATLLNCLTSLIYLTDYSKEISSQVLPFVLNLKNSESPRIKNLVTVYIEDYSDFA